MKISITPEIRGEEVSRDVELKLYETIQILFDEFGTVPEFGSKISVDLFKFIFEFTMQDKIYSFDGDELTINLVFEKTGELI